MTTVLAAVGGVLLFLLPALLLTRPGTLRLRAACLPQNAGEPAPDRQVVYAADRAVEQQDEPQKQVKQA